MIACLENLLRFLLELLMIKNDFTAGVSWLYHVLQNVRLCVSCQNLESKIQHFAVLTD